MSSQSYSFKNILGCGYTRGNCEFTHNKLYTLVENRIHELDLMQNVHNVLPVEFDYNLAYVLPTRTCYVHAIDVNGTLYYVNTSSTAILSRVNVHKGQIECAQLSNNDQYICCAYTNEISLWKIPDETTNWQYIRIWELRGHSGICRCIFWTQDNYILTCGDDMNVKVWSVEKFNTLTLQNNKQELRTVYQTKSKRYIVATGVSGFVTIWKWSPEDNGFSAARDIRPFRNKKKRQQEFFNQAEQFYDDKGTTNEDNIKSTIANIVDIDTIVSEESNSIVENENITDTFDMADFDTWKTGSWQYCARGYVPLKSMFVQSVCSNAAYNTICFAGSKGELMCVKINLDSDALSNNDLIVCDDLIVVLAETILSKTNNVSKRVEFVPISSVAFTDDSKWIACCSKLNYSVAVWEWSSNTFVYNNKNSANQFTCIDCLPVAYQTIKDVEHTAFGSTIIAAGTSNGSVVLYEADTGLLLHEFCEHKGIVTSVVFTLQRNTLASCSTDGSIILYDLYRYRSYKKVTPFSESEIHITPLEGLAIDTTGEILATYTNSSYNKVSIIDIKTLNVLETFDSNDKYIKSIQFANRIDKAGMLIITYLTEEVFVWDIFGRVSKGGKPITLRHPYEYCITTAHNPMHTNELAVSYLGGKIVIWNYDDELILKEIYGERDIYQGRELGSVIVTINKNDKDNQSNKYAKKPNRPLSFDFLLYLSDGEHLIAASAKSPKICIYNTRSGMLTSDFFFIRNLSYDGIKRKLNSSKVIDNVQTETLTDLPSDNFTEADMRIIKKINRKTIDGTDEVKKLAYFMINKLRVRGIAATTDNSALFICTIKCIYVFKKTESLTRSHMDTLGYNVLLNFDSGIRILKDTDTIEEFNKQYLNRNYISCLAIALSLDDKERIFLALSMIQKSEVSFAVQQLGSVSQLRLAKFIYDALTTSGTDKRTPFELYLIYIRALLLEFSKINNKTNSKVLKSILLKILDICVNYKEALISRYEYNVSVSKFVSSQLHQRL